MTGNLSDKKSLPIISSTITPELEAIFEAMEDGVCVQSVDSRILRANRAFATILNLPIDKIVGHTCAEVFGCGDNGEMSGFCARIKSIKTHVCESEEIPGRYPGQRFRARVSPVHSDKGEITAYVMVVRDITDLLRKDRELARSQQLALIGELAAGLAHEIKNPLAGIQGAMDILLQRRSPSDPEFTVLNNVRHEVSRIDTSVHTLLARTRPRSIKLESYSLSEVVKNAVMIARDQLAFSTNNTSRITIEYQPPDNPIVMLIDPPQVEDAVLNLIINAVEAIKSEGCVKVSLSCEEKNLIDEAVVTIEDDGPGIPEEHIQQIFSPFFTTKQNGTGLGLAAVRRIMRIHGGRVEVASKVGEGTMFKLRLPLLAKN